jgi:predicted enzyme related to lactoylglutathione lyase
VGSGNEVEAPVEGVNGIGGVFFRARDPEALTEWYRRNLGVGNPDNPSFPWHQEAGFTVWSGFPEDTGYFGRPDQQWMINFRVPDLDAMLAQLRAAGVEVLDKVEDTEYGRFGWVVDPEGNRVELWQPPTETQPVDG